MFIIFWRGWGILAPLILVAITMIVSAIADLFFHRVNYADSHHWVYAIGCLIGSIVCWYLGKKINGKPSRILIDEKTNERVVLKDTHSCFGIPFEYWAIVGLIYCVGNLILSILNITQW